MTKTVQINGAAEQVTATTLEELLRARELPLQGRGIAVAVNRTVVRKEDWPTTPLAEGDRIEIIRPIVGG